MQNSYPATWFDVPVWSEMPGPNPGPGPAFLLTLPGPVYWEELPF
jgi:hypothetical protein